MVNSLIKSHFLLFSQLLSSTETLQPTSKFWKCIFTHTNSVRRHIFGVNLILQCLSTCSVVFSTILSTEKTHFRAFQSNFLGIFWSKHHFFANGFDKFPFASFSLFCWVFSWYKLISYTCFIDYLQCVKMHFQNQEVGRRVQNLSQLCWEAVRIIENDFWLKNLQKCGVFCPQIGKKVLWNCLKWSSK